MKILFTDLDYTLLNNESKVSEYTANALRTYIGNGGKLVLASGRPLPSVMEVRNTQNIAFDGMYIIANNGSVIYDCTKDEVIRKKTVSFEDTVNIWKMALDMGIHIQTYTDDTILTCADDDEIKHYTKKIHIPYEECANPLDKLKNPPYKLLAVDLNNKDKLYELQNRILEEYGDRLNAVFSSDIYLEIFNITSGKGDAVTWLCDALDIAIDDAYAAGDAMNDLSMIEAAGHGIAMCNGCDEVKNIAEIITEYDNDNDGLARLIESL